MSLNSRVKGGYENSRLSESMSGFASPVSSLNTGCSGSLVWMTISPFSPLLPLRPRNCSRSWIALSSALKSWIARRESASITATSDSDSKSNPLVIIWVPTKISIVPFANPSIISLPSFSRVSPSSLATVLSGNSSLTSSSIF